MTNNIESLEEKAIKRSPFYIVPSSEISDKEINSVIELQNKYLRTGNVEQDKTEGRYLSTITDVELLKEMLKENGLVLLVDSETGRLASYALLSSLKLTGGIPKQQLFLERLKTIKYKGEKLEDKDVIIYHQICIDEIFRNGRAPLELSKEIKKRFSEKYKYVIGKIGDDNPKSLNLVLDHLGFLQLARYSEGNRSLTIVIQDFFGEKRKIDKKYERYARAYNVMTGVFLPYQELKKAHIDSVLQNTEYREWVLDFGAGTGNASFDLLNNERCVVALDRNENMLQYCRRQLIQFREDIDYKIVSQDIFDTDFSEGEFGAISAMNVLYHLKEGEHKKYLSEFLRLLKVGGVLLVSGPHSDTNSIKLRDFILKNISDEDKIRYKEHLEIAIESQKALVDDPDHKNISGEELVKIMQEVGFVDIEKSDTYYDGLNYFIKANKPNN